MKTKIRSSRLAPTLCMVMTALTSALWADVPPSRFAKASPDAPPEVRPQADYLQSLKQGVQITELGCMRATFVFDEKASAFETQVLEIFSNADFRVFPNATVVKDRVEPKALHQIGNDRYSDLVVYTRVSGRALPPLGSLGLVEAQAIIQVYNPLSEELLVSTTVTQKGQRSADPAVALSSAFDAAIGEAAKETIAKTLEKAHKILVHEAQFKGVLDHQHLLEIMEYTAKLQGVYHVRQLTYDKESKLAVVEIIAAPQTESFWRAYINNMPKRELLLGNDGQLRLLPNQSLREKNAGSWFGK